jgi:hypothetical protein
MPHANLVNQLPKLLGLWLVSVSTAACDSNYRTDLVNETSEPITVELVIKHGSLYSADVLHCANDSAGLTSTSAYGTRKRCTFGPHQVCTLGYTQAFFPVAPLFGDTLLVRRATGNITRITAKSVGSLVTDTARGSDGAEGRPYIIYTIRIR